MALIVPSGGLISQVNGKVNDKVYYRGRWGNVVRAWVNPTNTITPERTAARALFASLMALFNSLTPEMQDEWNQYAGYIVKFNRLAQPYVPTGLQVFMERNTNLAMISAGPILVPPPYSQLWSLKSVKCIGLSAITMDLTSRLYDGTHFIPANSALTWYATMPQSPGITNMTNRYRFINFETFPSPTNTNLIVPYGVVWPTAILTPGLKVFFKETIINNITGEASTPIYCSQIIS